MSSEAMETMENTQAAPAKGAISVTKDDVGDYHISCDLFQHPANPEWGRLALIHEGIKEGIDGTWEFHVYLERPVVYVDPTGIRHAERTAWLDSSELVADVAGSPRIERNRFARKVAAQRRQAAKAPLECETGTGTGRGRGRPRSEPAATTIFGVELRSIGENPGWYCYRHGVNDPSEEKGPFKSKLVALTFLRRK